MPAERLLTPVPILLMLLLSSWAGLAISDTNEITLPSAANAEEISDSDFELGSSFGPELRNLVHQAGHDLVPLTDGELYAAANPSHGLELNFTGSGMMATTFAGAQHLQFSTLGI